MSASQRLRELLAAVGFVLALAVWWRALTRPLDPSLDRWIVIGAPLLAVPVVLIGRYLLDAHPSPLGARWVTTFVHYGLAIPLGVAIATIVRSEVASPTWAFRFPSGLGWLLLLASGLASAATALNLAVRGLGAPFAIALTQRLASDRLYAWCRNPMVAAGLTFLVSLGLWAGSGAIIAWTLLLVAPMMILFLKLYEERELALRFGAPYLEYRARTRFLIPWPR